MKLSEYIRGLNRFLEKHGDLECYYARDSEGNDYARVWYCGTLLYADKLTYRPNMFCEEDLSELDDKTKLHKVCIIN